VHPGRLQPGLAGSNHIEMRVITDMQHFGVANPGKPAGLMEHARIGLGKADFMRADGACEKAPEADAIEIGIAVADGDQPIAR
jgi:hypothetical protein